MAVDGGLDIASEVGVHDRGGVLRHEGEDFGNPAPWWITGTQDGHWLEVLFHHNFYALPHFLQDGVQVPREFGFRQVKLRHIFDHSAWQASEDDRRVSVIPWRRR